jgi:hypothetical protein
MDENGQKTIELRDLELSKTDVSSKIELIPL